MSFHLFIRKVSCASYSACRKDFLSGSQARSMIYSSPHRLCKSAQTPCPRLYHQDFLHHFSIFIGPDGWPLHGDADDRNHGADGEVFDEDFRLVETEMNKILAVGNHNPLLQGRTSGVTEKKRRIVQV